MRVQVQASVSRKVMVVVLDGFGVASETESAIMNGAIARLPEPARRALVDAVRDYLARTSATVLSAPESLLPALLSPILPSARALLPEASAHWDGFEAAWRALRGASGVASSRRAVNGLIRKGAAARDYKPWAARTPYLRRIRNTYPTWLTCASGVAAGFQDIEPRIQGNSEAGHQQLMNLTVAFQPPMEISHAIATGQFDANPRLRAVLDEVASSGCNLNFCFLLSGDHGDDGKVHSSWDHLEAFLRLVFEGYRLPVERVRMQAILDGRDSPSRSAARAFDSHPPFLELLLDLLVKWNAVESLAWVIGRGVSMDRDYDEANAEKDFALLVHGQGTAVDSAHDVIAAVQRLYDEGHTDPTIPPLAIRDPHGRVRTVDDGDAFVDLNFRADRQRQKIASLLGDRAFLGEQAASRGKRWGFSWLTDVPRLHIACMTEYHPRLGEDQGVTIFFSMAPHRNNLLAILSDRYQEFGLERFRYLLVAESNKSLHVGFFLRGRREEPVVPDAERRIIVPSYGADAGIANDNDFYKTPQMKAFEIAGTVLNEVAGYPYDLVVLNISNCDMLGHISPQHPDAARRALEIVDTTLQTLIPVAFDFGYSVIRTEDHGNIEENSTAHTNNDVLTTVIGQGEMRCARSPWYLARLYDISWTAGELLGVGAHLRALRPAVGDDLPDEMVGRSLVALDSV
jgi:2,3-bisphosphoglycerate-independent phosphoglycerate mutase